LSPIFIGRQLIFSDAESRLAFLSKLADKVDKPSSQDAFVYAKVAVAKVQLQKQELDEAKSALTQSETILDTFDSVETSVHAAFYQVNSDYYQVRHACTIQGNLLTSFRQNTNSPLTTETLYYTLRASMWTT